jgi:hypothetical protein
LRQKIKLNKTVRNELKARIEELDLNKFDAFRFDATYLPLHYIIRYTPLNFIVALRYRGWGTCLIRFAAGIMPDNADSNQRNL